MAKRPAQDTHAAVDAFVDLTLFAGRDEVLEAALAESTAAGLPEIQVTAPQARLLEILCRLANARRILEFGTLGAFSTIVMARTLPEDGMLTTLEYDPDHAEVAWDNIERAGLADRVDLRVGAALETLLLLESEGAGPYDLVFIDGGIVDPEGDEDSAAQRTLHESIAAEPRVTATTIQTVGAKGYDGFTLALVNE